jgi:hypothetical protein
MVQVAKSELAVQVVLLRKQIHDSQYTARSLIGVMEHLPERSAARLAVKAAVKTLLVSIDLMTEALTEMEKEL